MELKLIELKNKSDMYKTYEIYKHCMFMPTEEKFKKKMDAFFVDDSIKIFACFHQSNLIGVVVTSFLNQREMEIIGIAVELSVRGKGVGSYMIKQIVKDYGLTFVYAETDTDAVGFYLKNGFSVTKFFENYGNETVIRYKCKLDSLIN